MYSVPKIKRFNTITQQAQKSWRSNLSSNSKRNFILQDIIQNLILIKDDLMSFFENNKEYLFPTENEEYICLDSASSIIPAEELLYRLIDILKNDDFISRLEEASSTIESLANQLDEAKKEIKKLTNKKNNDGQLSFNSEFGDAMCKDLIIKLKEKNLLNQKISKDYDNLVDDYLSGLEQKRQNEQRIRVLEENLKNFENIKLKNEELTENNKKMKDEIFLLKNELKDLKTVNNKLYEDNFKTKDELDRMYKMVEFKNKEFLDLTEKNKQLLKNNYTTTMELQRNEDKLKLFCNNLKSEKEKNKEIIDDLEKKINQKEEEMNKMRKTIKNNISNLLSENKGDNFKYILDEINNKLKIIYGGKIICCIPKFSREIPTSFYHRKKYKISSNIHPDISAIQENSIHNYKPMTLSKNNKITEVNNFNITYKLSKNEYEFDYSGSSKNLSNKSMSHSSFRLDKLCEQTSDSFPSNGQSKKNSKKSKNLNNNQIINAEKNIKIRKSFSQNFGNYLSENKNGKKMKNNINIRRSKTDIKGGLLLNRLKNKNIMKVNSFEFDVESIKEEKDEDIMSISNFDICINNKKDGNNSNNKNNNFNSLSNFLESGSIEPIISNKYNDKILVINHAIEFSINKLYFYPKDVKLRVKKINVKRIIHINKKEENNFLNNKNDCNIF